MKISRFFAILAFSGVAVSGLTQTPQTQPPPAPQTDPAPAKGVEYDPTRLAVPAKPAEPSQPAKKAFLWEVSSGSHILYLYGTMHVGHRSFFPLPEIVQVAFNRADKVAVEADITAVPSKAEMTALTEYRPPETLEKKIPPALYQRLKAVLGQYGVSPGVVRTMKPVMAAGLLSLLEYQKLGYEPGVGVDVFIIGSARQHGKPVVELESQLQQMKMLDGMPWHLQQAFLENAIAGVENGGAAIEVSDMIRAWQNGDDALMDRAMVEADKGKSHAAELEDIMLYRDHAAMVEKIETYLASGDIYFVAVGALHLSGDRGLPALLRAHGLTVTQK